MHVIHRGIVNKKFKENLLSSFKKSFHLGFGIETDIHATRDQKFICFHDFTFNRMFKKNLSIKNLNYSSIKKISTMKKNPIPLIEEVLFASKNKYPMLIELKPNFSIKLLKKLIRKCSKYSKCIFISFNHTNIYRLLRIKRNINVGLSFAYNSSIKTIIQKSKNPKIKFLVLYSAFLNKKKIEKLKIDKFFYTIKKKRDFKKYNRNNNLIFENL
tara:strand:- start:50 stop:691 length:642 start_codon:yes stop_codon:yes gene_type:complete